MKPLCHAHSSLHCPAHCSAIARAIPAYVRARIFARSGLGGILHTRCSLPSTISVGWRGGRPFSHRQVAFVSPWPNCHGCMIWSGFRYCVLIMPTGFSMAILGQSQFANFIKNSIAACCRPSRRFSSKYLAPLTARCVHGGNASTISHLIFRSSIASTWICH